MLTVESILQSRRAELEAKNFSEEAAIEWMTKQITKRKDEIAEIDRLTAGVTIVVNNTVGGVLTRAEANALSTMRFDPARSQ
jgi:hypothetical protein